MSSEDKLSDETVGSAVRHDPTDGTTLIYSSSEGGRRNFRLGGELGGPQPCDGLLDAQLRHD